MWWKVIDDKGTVWFVGDYDSCQKFVREMGCLNGARVVR